MVDGRFLQFLGTFLPVLGALGTVIGAVVTTGWKRWTALIVTPAVTLVITTTFASEIARDGNLLFAVLYLLFLLSLLVYYPVLLIIGAKRWFDARKQPG